MSGLFTAASSQYLLNSTPPFTGLPITVGGWVKQANTTAGKIVWSLVDGTSATSNGWAVAFGLSQTMQTMVAGATNSTSMSGGTTNWTFFLMRWISSTNRQGAILQADGGINTVSTVTSLVPTVTPNRSGIGARVILTPDNFFEGNIAELWWTNTDIQPDGGVIDPATLRQLAWGGPFSMPHIAKDLVDYRSMRLAVGSDQDQIPDYFLGYKGRQTWVNTNGPILGAHPPLPYWYRRSGRTILPIWLSSYPDGVTASVNRRFQAYFSG